MNNRFENNYAKYGVSIGSYAFTLKLLNSSYNDQLLANSGKINENIIIGIYDQQGEIVNNDYNSEGVLYTNDLDNLQIIGDTKVIARKGIFNFKDIKFTAKPNSTQIIYFSSNIINKARFE